MVRVLTMVRHPLYLCPQFQASAKNAVLYTLTQELHSLMSIPLRSPSVSKGFRFSSPWKQRSPNWERVVSCQQSPSADWEWLADFLAGLPTIFFERFFFFFPLCMLTWLGRRVCLSGASWTPRVCSAVRWGGWCAHHSCFLHVCSSHDVKYTLSNSSCIYVASSAWTQSCSGYPGHNSW